MLGKRRGKEEPKKDRTKKKEISKYGNERRIESRTEHEQKKTKIESNKKIMKWK